MMPSKANHLPIRWRPRQMILGRRENNKLLPYHQKVRKGTNRPGPAHRRREDLVGKAFLMSVLALKRPGTLRSRTKPSRTHSTKVFLKRKQRFVPRMQFKKPMRMTWLRVQTLVIRVQPLLLVLASVIRVQPLPLPLMLARQRVLLRL